MTFRKFDPYSHLETRQAPPPVRPASPKAAANDPAALATLAALAAAPSRVANWPAFFAERLAALRAIDGELLASAAGVRTLEICASLWQAQNPPAIPADGLCAHCGEQVGKSAGLVLALRSAEGRAAEIHAACHAPFIRAQRERALESLAAAGVRLQ